MKNQKPRAARRKRVRHTPPSPFALTVEQVERLSAAIQRRTQATRRLDESPASLATPSRSRLVDALIASVKASKRLDEVMRKTTRK